MHNCISLNKKFLLLPTFLMLSSLLLIGCWEYPYPPTPPTTPTTPTPPILPAYLTEIVVQPDTMNLEEGESQYIISVNAYYSDSSTANIPLTNCSYFSYNPSCATVNSSGLITGASTGTAVILVIYTEDVISKTDTVTIDITTTPITPAILSYIEVLPSVMSLNVEESQIISSVTAYYDDSSSANIALTNCSYTSSNPDCATVSNSGTVTAVSDGSATITISYTEDGITKTTSAEITVGTVTQNEVVYRALCVGVGDYIQGSDNDLSAPPYDVDKIRQILEQCRFGTSNATFSNIISGADSDDVSYFYFSGHGSLVGNTSYICPADMTSFVDSAISVNELENALSSIPGTKVVFLDSCHSGGFIGKGVEEMQISKEKLKSFNDEVINVFSQAQSKGLLTTNQYKVLTSCHYYQECMELSPVTPGDFDPFGVFTLALCEGCGYSGNYPADTNMDTKVSLQEAYLYVRDWVFSYRISQDVQIYPDNSTFTVVDY